MVLGGLMFLNIVFICLMIMLFLSTGSALFMGIFKGKTGGVGRKVLERGISYGISLVFWCSCYSWHYLGW